MPVASVKCCVPTSTFGSCGRAQPRDSARRILLRDGRQRSTASPSGGIVFKKLLRTAIFGSATLATALVLTCGPAGASTFWATSSYLIPRTSCTESASLVSHLDSAGHLLVQAEGRMPCTGRTASGTAFTITTWAQWWYNSQLQGYDSPASAAG